VASALLLLAACASDDATFVPPPTSPAIPPGMTAWQQEIPGAAFAIELVPIPGDAARGIAPFWISRTEITWDAYDAFLLKLDEKGAPPPGADAISRPTKPYLPPDRGFGHEGYPAMSLSLKNVLGFCAWLSTKTGNKYRLPTEAEWEWACRAGSSGAYAFGDDARQLAAHAWFQANAATSDKLTTHPVGKKRKNGFGLADMHGNVAEWCTGEGGQGVVRGGSFRDAAGELRCDARRVDDPLWNRDDPNIPKGTWWLVNGDWIGFRIVCETKKP
jgi:formylglycine-generating enzyme required for sulfatase activity